MRIGNNDPFNTKVRFNGGVTGSERGPETQSPKRSEQSDELCQRLSGKLGDNPGVTKPNEANNTLGLNGQDNTNKARRLDFMA
jgi:hypothetical protein